MAVIIKNMVMPKACESCPMLGESGYNYICNATKELQGSSFAVREQRMPYCPLQEVKEPKQRESRKKLPCPKCGTPRPETWFGGGMAGVRCRNCGLEVWSKTEIKAIRAWNAMKREG